ncbi:hypothetical protein C2I18_17400 [Paenibacillus sp. PK3_47]|uniref:hypothetical protein n=1 Tax=Paenibacillus sp. PK3_47 TaxID=2072642 RepID=UPI00201E688E|nr:hypothetical protein [Paenibacillus sp. PK3_47]UQZ35145.1 hypothetical protein C2I18_17400 [Paenibacillus sp. PK3_47]
MLILVYLFAALGVALLLAAVVLRFRLSCPPSGLKQLSCTLAALDVAFSKQFITPDNSHIIALDDTGKQLAIGMYHPDKEQQGAAKLYTFDSILGAEIIENALTLSKVGKTSLITSSPVKRGPVRLREELWDRPDGSREAEEEINELTLKIYLSSTDTPVLAIPFLPGRQPAKKSDEDYSRAYLAARQVHEAIRGIVSA